jgi:CheY-like chemotaxis protein
MIPDTQDMIDPAKWNILVTDDDPFSAQIIEMTCSFHGARVRTASTGEECLDLYTKDKPNIVFLDIQMPGMDGPTLLKAIRDKPDAAGLIAIAVTANVYVDNESLGLEHGFDAYFPKPISPISLIDNVKTVISKRRIS